MNGMVRSLIIGKDEIYFCPSYSSSMEGLKINLTYPMSYDIISESLKNTAPDIAKYQAGNLDELTMFFIVNCNIMCESFTVLSKGQ